MDLIFYNVDIFKYTKFVSVSIYILCIYLLFKKVVAGYNFLGIRSETRYKVRSIFKEF